MGIGFLGAGKMATALASGWKDAGLALRSTWMASDVSENARLAFAAATGFSSVSTNREVLNHCRTIILAVKPQAMPALMQEIRPFVTPDHLFLSIAAGISLDNLIHGLETTRVIRVMPNTPALIKESATAYTCASGARTEDRELVSKLFGAVGQAHLVPESFMDAVTGLSGSGPAFVFMMIEAMSDAGVRVGLPRDIATSLAAQTLLGAAKMVLENKGQPGILKDMVTSEGGTTIAGIHALEKGGLRAALMDAVVAATNRSRELGKS